MPAWKKPKPTERQLRIARMIARACAYGLAVHAPKGKDGSWPKLVFHTPDRSRVLGSVKTLEAGEAWVEGFEQGQEQLRRALRLLLDARAATRA